MPEKRAAMKKWNVFVRALLNKKRPSAAEKRARVANSDAAETTQRAA
jgi:hypothetical protein